MHLAGVLPVELAAQALGARLECGDARAAHGGLLLRAHRVVRHHEAMAFPARLGNGLGVSALGRRVQRPQQLGELAVAPPRHRQDELQRLAAGQRDAR